jgi:hypothetical protein
LSIVSWLTLEYIFNYIEEKISKMRCLLHVLKVVEMFGWCFQLLYVKLVWFRARNEFSIYAWECCQSSITQESLQLLIIIRKWHQTSKFFKKVKIWEIDIFFLL